MSNAQETDHSPRKLGAFLGVFTPSILTILGVIMYLRFGWVLGQAGLMRTLVIVAIANSITLITALSVSALATNIRVGVGGDYFLLSRSLGIEIGGALGLPLFLSQALSVTLYSFGFAESLQIVYPGVNVQLAALVIVVIIGLLAGRSAGLALKLQVPLMLFVALSLVLLAIGGDYSTIPVPRQVHASYPGFWVVFAVFFPAVTGVTTGVSMSGDLRDPSRAIPRGVMAAVLTGFAVYMMIPLVLAFNADSDSLVSDSMIWMKIATQPKLILPGLWGAILSSAIGSALAAPRTLQALAIDRIVPGFLRKIGRSGEPVNAMILTIIIAVGAVALGNLNAVAVVVTMFFLTSYGMGNLGAAMEALIGDPSFRPKVRVPWYISLTGFAGCLWAMFLVNPAACITAIAIEISLWVYLRRRALTATWGDVWRGYYQSLIRWALFRLRRLPHNPRSWRPNILLFAGNIAKRLDLVQFATWFGQNRGLVSICDLILEGETDRINESIDFHREEMDRLIEAHGLTAFSQVNVADAFEDGAVNVAQASGIGGFGTNTVMMGWNSDPEGLAAQLRIMRNLGRFHKSFILAKFKERRIYHRSQKIVIWWGGLERNGDLMLLLAHLLCQNPVWADARILLRSFADDDAMKENTTRYLEKLLPEIRIDADYEVLIRPDDQPLVDRIQAESRDAEVVFLGLKVPEAGQEGQYADWLLTLAEELPTVFFVRNAAKFMGNLVKMEETSEE